MGLFRVLIFLGLMLSPEASNELLDYIPTDAYWQAKGVRVETDAVLAELRALGGEELDAPAGVRRLMAIRALGELRGQAAVETLRGLRNSKGAFVREYAEVALAKVRGGQVQATPSAATQPTTRPAAVADASRDDLAVLPSGVDVIVQLRLEGRGPVDLDRLFIDTPTIRRVLNLKAGDGEAPDPAAHIAREAVDLAERIGNARVDGITIGMSGFLDYGGVVLHGRFDRDAIAADMRRTAGTKEAVRGEMLVFQRFSGGTAFVLPREERVIHYFSHPDFRPGDKPHPVDEALRLLTQDHDGDPARPERSTRMVALLDTVDRTGPIWAVADNAASFGQGSTLTGLQTLMVETRPTDGGGFRYTLTGEGDDETRVAMTAQSVQESLDPALKRLRERLEMAKPEEEPETTAMLQTAIDLLETIQVRAEGHAATLSGKAERGLIDIATTWWMLINLRT